MRFSTAYSSFLLLIYFLGYKRLSIIQINFLKLLRFIQNSRAVPTQNQLPKPSRPPFISHYTKTLKHNANSPGSGSICHPQTSPHIKIRENIPLNDDRLPFIDGGQFKRKDSARREIDFAAEGVTLTLPVFLFINNGRH